MVPDLVDEHVADDVAQVIEGAREVVARFVGPGEAVYIAPFDLGLYPALGLKAPQWEIYPLFPASPAFEAEEIQRIEAARTKLAILSRAELDDRPELHFSATHPMITRYFGARFLVVNGTNLPQHLVALVRP